MAFEDFIAFYEAQGYTEKDAILLATLNLAAERAEDAYAF